MRDRGYGQRIDTEDKTPPPDPEAAARRQKAMAMLIALIEERAKEGKPPLLAQLLGTAGGWEPSTTPKADSRKGLREQPENCQ